MSLKTSSEISSEGEEDDEDSSSFNMRKTFKSALEEFRENWQNEIRTSHRSEHRPPVAEEGHIESNNPPLIDESDDEKAERLFKVGIHLEQSGKVYDALQYYRKAVQLVPDIEFRIYEISKRNLPLKTEDMNSNMQGFSNEYVPDSNKNFDETESLEGINLVQRFKSQLGSTLMKSSLNDKVLSTQIQISDLPTEIIYYILKWIISNQLDMHSLEQVAATCKGLYLCARDEELWKLACVKVWNINTGSSLQETKFRSWRDMFIRRERIHFNGCYISKTSYLRYGENSFQDEFYRPVQLIMYFRYIRFLPDGTVFMMTTSDEPQIGVIKLRNLQSIRSEVLRGRWRLHGNIVTIICIKANLTNSKSTVSRRRGSMINMETSSISTTYYIEMSISGTSKKTFCQLHWNKYSLIQKRANGTEAVTEFELSNAKFPPLWFSRVKSYHLVADMPL